MKLKLEEDEKQIVIQSLNVPEINIFIPID